MLCANALRRLRSLDGARMIGENIPGDLFHGMIPGLFRHLPDQLHQGRSERFVDQQIDPGREALEVCALRCIAAHDERTALVVEAVADGRLDRRMIDTKGADAKPPLVEHDRRATRRGLGETSWCQARAAWRHHFGAVMAGSIHGIEPVDLVQAGCDLSDAFGSVDGQRGS